MTSEATDAHGTFHSRLGARHDRQWNTAHEIEVDLIFPDVAMDMNGNVGRWSMVYNQVRKLISELPSPQS